jgi:hypothetical protein
MKDSSNDPRYAEFGMLVWEAVKKEVSAAAICEYSDQIMCLAKKAGLCFSILYDPDLHDEIEGSEPGDEIWWWGDSVSTEDSQ